MAQINLKKTNTPLTPQANKIGLYADIDGALRSIDENGNIKEIGSNTSGLISISYDNLLTKVTNSELEPGANYLITDFRTVHHILDNSISRTGDIHTGELEPLIVKAVTINELDKEAISTVYPKDIIYYNITSDIRDIAFYTDDKKPVAGYKGQIYFRHDTIQNVSTWYDFRNVKFRRWLVEATAWVSEDSYTAKDVVEYNDILYRCKVTHSGVSTAPDLDSINWTQWLDKTINWSWTSDKAQFRTGGVTTSNLTMSNPVDLLTFGDYYERVKNTSIGRNDLSFLIEGADVATILNNIVFNTTDDIYTCFSNTFGETCFNNTIGDGFESNTIGNEFMFNTIGDAFHSNTIGDAFHSNTIWDYFYSNTIGDKFTNNTVGDKFTNNTVGDYFQSNTIGDSFNSNTIGNSFYSNTIRNNFRSNTIEDYFNSNIIGNSFESNTIRNNFMDNTIGDYFNSNTIGNDFWSNTIGDSFRSNIIGNSFRSNIIGNSFRSNTIGDTFMDNIIGNNFINNTIKSDIGNIDFTLATHVYGNYDCEIFKRLDGTERLRYTDNNDAILTVAPND